MAKKRSKQQKKKANERRGPLYSLDTDLGAPKKTSVTQKKVVIGHSKEDLSKIQADYVKKDLTKSALISTCIASSQDKKHT